MKSRNIFRIVLSFSIVIALISCIAFAVTVQAEPSVTDSGFCGASGNEENVTWTFYDDGSCVISGTGEIADYPPRIGYISYSTAPWACAEVLIIEEGITKINQYAFAYMDSMTEVSLPSTVTEIGEHAFEGCNRLKSLTVPDGITVLPAYICYKCSDLVSVDIPDTVTEVGSCAFWLCKSLGSVSIPSGVTEIGSNTFNGCAAIESISIPDGVTKIGEEAFKNCSALNEIYIPETVTFVGNDAFEDTAWINNRPEGPLYIGKVLYSAGNVTEADFIIKPGTTQIMEMAGRSNPAIQTISIPGTVRIMGQAAFSGCANLKKLYIEEGVSYINQSAFGGCASLEEVILPSTMTDIYSSSFDYCPNLTEFIIPAGVSLGAGVLSHTGLTKIVFPDSMTVIPYGLCTGCENLTSACIPKSVTMIDKSVFNGCVSLTDIYYEGSEEEWNALFIDTGNDPVNNAVIHFGTEHMVQSVKRNYTEPTCSQKGSYELIEKCLMCGEVYSTQTVEIPKVEHILVQYEGKAPDCVHPGWEDYEACSRCDYTTYSAIQPTGIHTPGQAVEENITPSTCQAKGSYDEVYYCTVCKAETGRERKELPLSGHSAGEWVSPKAATCKETGTIGYYICTGCGEKLDGNNNVLTDITEPLNPSNHAYGTSVINKKQAGCETKGYTGDTICAGCQAVLSKGSETKAAGHKWNSGTVTKNASCTQDGVKTFTCSVCKKTRTEKIQKTDHQADENGYCKFCGKDLMPEQRCQYCGQVHTGIFAWLINLIHKILMLFK